MVALVNKCILYLLLKIGNGTQLCAGYLRALPAQQVLLGRWRGGLVAVKVLHESCMEHAGCAALDGFRTEAEMLQSLHHPNIINFYGACFEGKQVRYPLLTQADLHWLQILTLTVLSVTCLTSCSCADDVGERGTQPCL